MSPQLSTRCALALLGALVLASAMGLLALGPIAAPDDGHRLTDPRAVWGIANGWSVLLQAPLLLAGCLGLLAARWTRAADPLARAWTAFFVLVLAATGLGMVDHAAPDAGGYVLAKVPAASACALLAALFLAERVSLSWVGPRVLWPVLLAGPAGGLLWFASNTLLGEPDYRLLLWLEHLPMLLVPLGVWSLQSRGLRSADWIAALLWFGLAQLIDWADEALWEATGHAISGHALHHLALAACIASLAWSVARHAGTGETVAGRSSQLDTSLITSG